MEDNIKLHKALIESANRLRGVLIMSTSGQVRIVSDVITAVVVVKTTKGLIFKKITETEVEIFKGFKFACGRIKSDLGITYSNYNAAKAIVDHITKDRLRYLNALVSLGHVGLTITRK